MLILLYPCIAIPVFAVHAALPAHGEDAEDPQAAVQAVNAFASDLYGALSAQPGNLIYSPYSLSSALGMTYAGAKGETAREMARTLSFPEDAALHASFKRLGAALNGSAGECTLEIANALWVQEGYAFLDAYTDLVARAYGAGLETLDFQSDPEGARETINAWVASRTNDLIQDLFPPGAIDPLTRLALTNAVYFKGAWLAPFDAGLTKDAPFRLADGETVDARMMQRTGSYPYGETEEAQVLELPYAGEGLAMTVVLPREGRPLADVEQRIADDGLAVFVEAPRRAMEVRVAFPRFRMAAGFSLAQTLARMGMPLAFSDAADFSGMTGRDDLKISAVEHKACIDVTEEGTEAAAATGVSMIVKTIAREPKVFRADRPFVFAIRDRASGAVLFLGRVMDPRDD